LALLLALVVVLPSAGRADGRTGGRTVPAFLQAKVRLRAATPIHAEPNGNQLGTLPAGFQVTPGRTSGAWREIPVQGWIWTASTGAATRPGFDLGVTADDGENLRMEPDGPIVFKAVKGTQFDRVSRRGGWTQVRRTVWLAAAAVAEPSQTVGRSDGRTVRDPDVPTQRPAAQAAPVPPPAAPPPADTLARVIVRKGTSVSAGPGGSSMGTLAADLPAEVMARSGEWVRIRTEGWVRREDVRPAPDPAGVTLEQLLAAPEKHVGQAVVWRLQFIALQVADELRPELPPGEPYVLARGPLPEAGFVYVSVTRDQAERFREMSPLDEFTANGTIRSARTRYLPTPVIELRRTP